jgi:antitoxin component of MazEF toxin-antitoxin module
MPPIELKVTRIGNSRGVRIPAATLERYDVGDTLVMEERSDGILLRPAGKAIAKLSWADTAREMASAAEDWSDWDVTAVDGLASVEWVAPRRAVAEPKKKYSRRRAKRSR